ncbi:hypothetical protein Lesp01_89950 [Lentzea sp. NBRC 102530]|nr:hypothetical protein Lesp01_89950 [Lentzea sp. NBRC 102530]
MPRHRGHCTCACGKRGYGSRKEARTIAKNLYPSDHMNAYRCDKSPYFHFGHPWPGVRDWARKRRSS